MLDSLASVGQGEVGRKKDGIIIVVVDRVLSVGRFFAIIVVILARIVLMMTMMSVMGMMVVGRTIHMEVGPQVMPRRLTIPIAPVRMS